jgi:hypothetical protein
MKQSRRKRSGMTINLSGAVQDFHGRRYDAYR